MYAFLGALVVLAGLSLTAYAAVPRLTGQSPAGGAQGVSSLAPLRLTFSHPMDHASVEGALELAPPQAGVFRWEGNTLLFIPAGAWPVETTVTVTLSGGRSQGGWPLLGGHTWPFTIGGPRIACLVSGPASQLWVVPLTPSAAPQQVTREEGGVYSFDVSPDGTQFVYAALRADGGADLKIINRDGTGSAVLLDCPGTACLSPAVSPDGLQVAYERRSLVTDPAGAVTFGESIVHLYTPATSRDEPLAAADTLSPAWLADGRLSFFDAVQQAIVLRDLRTGASAQIPNASGREGTWSPGGQQVVFPEIYLPPENWGPLPGGENAARFITQLVRVTVATGEAERLSGEARVQDASPAFSPNGDWLAFGRQGLTPRTWTPGYQLWLMRSDGSEAHALTADPLSHHSGFVWSPDGTALIYLRRNAADPAVPTEIWTIPADGSGARKLIDRGYLPEWLP